MKRWGDMKEKSGTIPIVVVTVAALNSRRNVRINAVAPGVIATEMFDRFAEGALRDQITSMIPVGRSGVTEEIAAAGLSLLGRREVHRRDLAGCRWRLGSAIN
jgi:NAD(P)-dependent dehydrogenase (short-subunit alcohol dehydrogenase family)